MPSNNYDPSKATWDGTSINDWEPANWKQWKPKHTGTDYPAVIEREYLRIKYSVQQANQSLDAENAKVKLKMTSAKAIALQGTFPCKEGDVGKNGSPNKQYVISIGTAANDAGVKTALNKARELDWQLTTKQFQWTPELLGKQAQKITLPENEQPKLIGELVEEYEKEHWKTHSKDRKSLYNWKNNYLKHLKTLPDNEPLSEKALTQTLEKTKPNTSNRKRLVWQLKKFTKFCNYNDNGIVDSFSVKKVSLQPRKPPNDDEIVQGFNKIGAVLNHAANSKAVKPEEWQWLYGMLATYGLRTHEIFAVDLEAFTNPENTYHLITLNPELTEGTKTGERKCGIPPLHPEWVELFDLKNIRCPKLSENFDNRTIIICNKFRRSKVGFKSYNLRHAYAIRGHKLRIPIKTMADYMGHSVQEHTESYQRWMDKDANLEIYKEVVLEKQAQTKEDLKEQIKLLKSQLTTQATQLTEKDAEIERLKALLVKHQLDELLN